LDFKIEEERISLVIFKRWLVPIRGSNLLSVGQIYFSDAEVFGERKIFKPSVRRAQVIDSYTK